KEVRKDSVTDVVNFVSSLPSDTQITILSPLHPHNQRKLKEELAVLLQKGFVRVEYLGRIEKIESLIEDKKVANSSVNLGDLRIVIDRIRVNQEDETLSRIADSVQTAFFEGKGDCYIDDGEKEHFFCDRFELDGMAFEEPTPNFFSFNNHYGACSRCEGYEKVIGIDPDLVVPDKSKSVYDGAIAPWRGEKMGEWLNRFVKVAIKFDFPVHRAYKDLSPEQRQVLWSGNQYFRGLDDFFKELEEQTYKIQYRVMLSRYRGKTDCPDCKGTRLRKDAAYVKVGGKSITDMVLMPLD